MVSTTYADNEIEQSTLSASDSVHWVLPLLKEYAAKLNAANERSTETLEKLHNVGGNPKEAASIEALRLVHYFDALIPDIENIVRQASGLLEHSPVPVEQELELKLRLEELEVHLQFARFLSEKLTGHLKSTSDLIVFAKSVMDKVKRKLPT
jgi:hypothetical protein